MHTHVRVEGKGREGKGREGKGRMEGEVLVSCQRSHHATIQSTGEKPNVDRVRANTRRTNDVPATPGGFVSATLAFLRRSFKRNMYTYEPGRGRRNAEKSTLVFLSAASSRG